MPEPAEPAASTVAVFTRDPAAVPSARRLVRSWLADRGLAALNAPLELATAEVVGNAVRHGAGRITLGLHRLDAHIRIEVHDQGGRRPSRRPTSTSGQGLGGWGLRMLDQLVDAWGAEVSDGHTLVWLQHPTIGP